MHRLLPLLLLAGCAASHEPYAWDGWELTLLSRGWPQGSAEIQIDATGRFESRRYWRLEGCEGQLTADDEARWLDWIEDHQVLEQEGELDEERTCLHCAPVDITVRAPDGRATLVTATQHPLARSARRALDGFLETAETRCTRIDPVPSQMHVYLAGHDVEGELDATLWLQAYDAAYGSRSPPFTYPERMGPCPGALDEHGVRERLYAMAVAAAPGPGEPTEAQVDHPYPVYVQVTVGNAYARYEQSLDSPIGELFTRAVRSCPRVRE